MRHTIPPRRSFHHSAHPQLLQLRLALPALNVSALASAGSPSPPATIMRPRQSIDIGTFQFQRTTTRRTSLHSASAKSSLLPPIAPLRERTNLLPTAQPLIDKPCQLPRTGASSTKASRTTTSTRKRLLREPLHKQIDPNLSEPQRAFRLIELSLEKVTKSHFARNPTLERTEFERANEQALQTVHHFVQQCDRPDQCDYKPNPEAADVHNRICQMEALERACKHELAAWESIAPLASQHPEWSTPTHQQPQDVALDESDAERVFESYILQTRHMLSVASRLRGMNLETHYRVQVVAAALNDKVMSRFNGRPSEVLKPPDTLHVSSVNDEINPRL